jgi:hypothetical protein
MTNNYLPSLKNIAADSKGWEMFGGQKILSEIATILLNQSPKIPYKDARTAEAERLLDQELSLYFNGDGRSTREVIQDAAEAVESIQ